MQLFHKTAQMESIAYPMVNLDGKGQKGFVLFLVEFAHGKNGKQIVNPFCRFRLKPEKLAQGIMETGKVFSGGSGLPIIPLQLP